MTEVARSIPLVAGAKRWLEKCVPTAKVDDDQDERKMNKNDKGRRSGQATDGRDRCRQSPGEMKRFT